MARKEIGTGWDRKNRNAINDNFIKLFNEYTESGLNASEAKEKAEQAVADSLLAKDTAETTREEMLAIIREQTQNGDLAPEVTQARGEYLTIGERLNSSDQQLAQIATNVKNFGAKGDGSTDDTQSIQDAINFVVNQTIGLKQGGKVYLPAGTYRVSDTIELDSHVEFCGAGMYLTTLLPDFLGDSVFQNIIRIHGTAESRKENVVLHDFGIDGSNVEPYYNDRGFQVGQWARIEPRNVDNFLAHDIYCYHGSHLFQMTGCENFIIDRIRCDYNFNVVHMTSGGAENKQGVISNIVATRVATVLDWGAGGDGIIVSDVYGNNEGYPRNNEEALDIGGAKNIQINNCVFENFDSAVTLKGEGAEWNNIEFNNIQFLGVNGGIRATSGDQNNIGLLKISDCYIYSGSMLSGGYAIEVNGFKGDVRLNNVQIDVNEHGIAGFGFDNFEINNVKIKCDGDGLTFRSYSGNDPMKWKINGININAKGTGFLAQDSQGESQLSNFRIEGCGSDAIKYLRVKNPLISNGLILNTYNQAISLTFDESHINSIGTFNHLSAEVNNVVIRDWGINSSNKLGLYLSVPVLDNSQPYTGLKLRNITFEILGEQYGQNGISWYNFTNNNLDYSWLDGITFYRVPKEQASSVNKGSNNIERIMSIK